MVKERGRFVFLFFVGFILHSVGYSMGDWEGQIKNENGLVKEQRQEVEVLINESGNLDIVSHIYEETVHFGNNANIYSEQSIGFSETFTEIEDLEAYSYIPTDRGKFKKIEVEDFIVSDSRSDGVFYDDQKKISFVYPALKAGSKTVLSYTKRYKEPRLWGYYLFSSFFPVEKSTYTVTAPESVALNYFVYGIDSAKIRFTKEKKGSKVFYTWQSDQLDKIMLSRGSDGLLNSAPHLIIYVDSYEYNGEKRQVLGGVSDLHSWYQKFLNGIDDENSSNLESMVNNIVAGKSTELEKVEAIYNWVQQNIKYIAIEDGLGGFRPRSASTVLTRRYGDCKDMSNLLHNMLDIANIPSNLAWIGTKSIPYSHREVPTPMADNHMICTYTSGGKYYFLDATDQYNILGMPTSHIQGREALVHKGNSDYELVDVPIVPSDQNQIVDSIFLSIDKNQLMGTGKVTYSGYNRIPMTNSIENLSGDEKKNFLNAILKKGNNKFSLNSVQTEFVVEKEQPLEIDYAFTLDDYIFNMSDEIFVNLHLDKQLEDGFVDVDAVKKDIFYPYKSMTSNFFSIEIPENYTISYLPESCSYQSDDFGFKIDYVVTEDHVILNQNININTIKLKTGQFDSWNKMIKGLFAAYKESIVFKKL